jgi:hypothetical protein
LVLAGIFSALYWAWTTQNGVGDLRPYALVQFLPILALPFILLLYRRYTYLPTAAIFWLLAWYILAKLFEHYDGAIFDLTGQLISGHSLKHLAAAAAPLVIAQTLWRRSKSAVKLQT